MEYKLTYKTYNDALKKNKLLGLKCNDCGTVTCPPKMTCQECTGTNLEITELSGKGKIATFTTSFVAPLARECEAPYTIVLVELEEGAWIMGNLIDIDPAKVGMELIGRKVKLGFKVFPGDMYSAGAGVRPLFSFLD
jgi:uncharacterized OB-fold protein